MILIVHALQVFSEQIKHANIKTEHFTQLLGLLNISKVRYPDYYANEANNDQ